jgi:hypothetical protein
VTPGTAARSADHYGDAHHIPFCPSGIHRRDETRIIGATTTATAFVALLALVNVFPANAGAPVPREPALVLASATDIQVPSDDQAVELADRSMRVFMASVREKSMQGLWDHISPRFREKFSVAQLNEAFKGFFGLTITGDPLAGKSPIFAAAPVIDGNSNLIVDGFYATLPLRVGFHLVFAMEGRAWKLVGINVTAKPPSAPAASQSPDPDVGSDTRYQAL